VRPEWQVDLVEEGGAARRHGRQDDVGNSHMAAFSGQLSAVSGQPHAADLLRS
jgi:hypothetical protein